jgi:hypothetical protein
LIAEAKIHDAKDPATLKAQDFARDVIWFASRDPVQPTVYS